MIMYEKLFSEGRTAGGGVEFMAMIRSGVGTTG